MRDRRVLWLVLFFLLPGVQGLEASPARSPADFLYELAEEYLKSGQEAEAIHELHKLLLMDPSHTEARQRLAQLERQRDIVRDQAIEDAFGRIGQRPSQVRGEMPAIGREIAIEEALRHAGRPSAPAVMTPAAPVYPLSPIPEPYQPLTPSTSPTATLAERALAEPVTGVWPPTEPSEAGRGSPKGASQWTDNVPISDGGFGPVNRLNDKIAPLHFSGEVRSSLGMTADDVIAQEANGDLNERNFRVFSGNARYNTFDPRIFSRLRVNLDTDETTNWQLHSNITIDPWSFVGKTDPVTVTGTTPTDSVEVELKWWSNTNTAINETFLTLQNGDSIATPEIETNNGETVATCVSSTFGNTFCIPELDIDYSFQPVRWLVTGYKNEVVDWRLMPLALEDQAMTSDDPLNLSNHHIYWEPSPWLEQWVPGRVNTGATPVDFTRGRFSDDLSFFTRDSDLTRLTALRGTTLRYGLDDTHVQAGLASPKGLWQDYGTFDTLVGMARLKQEFLDDRFHIGLVHTNRTGYTESSRDSNNRVYSVDSAFSPVESVKWEGQTAYSTTTQDRTTNFKSSTRGWAWHNAVNASWLEERLAGRIYYTHMDEAFDPGLASYFNTARDRFWGRHLRFKRKPKIWMSLSPVSPMRWQEIEGSRIGDGADVGRDALGLKLTGSWMDETWQPLFHVRNVHEDSGKYVETVWRQENTFQPLRWLTAKTMILYHDLPKTTAGIDPFLVDTDTNQPLANATIVDGADPDLTTFSLGAEVAPTESFAVWGVWERTNDTTVATDNFPRGLLNSSSFRTFSDNNQTIRTTSPFLFNQGFYPQPPYPFFDIFRAGIYVAPTEQLEFAFDATRNEFEHAGQIDDNLNHLGFTAAWAPTKRLVVLGRYVVSWAIDATDLNSGNRAKTASHHNLYGRLTWKLSEDSDLSLEYGEVALGTAYLFTVDPLGDFYPTLDTEHLVRILYSNTF